MTSRVKLVVAGAASGQVTSSGKKLELGTVLLEGEIPKGLTEADVVLALRRGFNLFPVESSAAKAATPASGEPMGKTGADADKTTKSGKEKVTA